VLPAAVACDRAGEQYALLLGDLQRPCALIEVARRHIYAGVAVGLDVASLTNRY
jgi:hypothetical protein